MASKTIAALAACALFAWSGAQAASGESQPAAAEQLPDRLGGSGELLILELGPMQGQPTPEEIAAMQMLLLQLLMMQGEPGAETQIIVPSEPTGVAI